MNPIVLDERQVNLLLAAERYIELALQNVHMAKLGTINSNRMLETLANAKQGVRGFLGKPY